MKLDIKADVTGVCDRRDVHCLVLRGVLNFSCKKRAAVCFLLLVAVCQREQVSTDKKTSLSATLKLGHTGFLFGFAFLLQPLSAGLRCSNVQVEEPLQG